MTTLVGWLVIAACLLVIGLALLAGMVVATHPWVLVFALLFPLQMVAYLAGDTVLETRRMRREDREARLDRASHSTGQGS